MDLTTLLVQSVPRVCCPALDSAEAISTARADTAKSNAINHAPGTNCTGKPGARPYPDPRGHCSPLEIARYPPGLPVAAYPASVPDTA
eukprot:1787482-Rhodomonas_salina.2